MTQSIKSKSQTWSSEWTLRVGANLAALREQAGVSGQQLADLTEAHGDEISRSTIANLESGRKSSVSVAEIALLAAALGVSPMRLLFDPTGSEVETLPGLTTSQAEAADWFAGLKQLPIDSSDASTEPEFSGPLPLYRRHTELSEKIRSFTTTHGETAPVPDDEHADSATLYLRLLVSQLESVRNEMKVSEYKAPELPADLRIPIWIWRGHA
ncbi:helix-turn-helix domain-containing protein [Demequina aurantiaca]|uniref:helix-turn-helix domain-containing protein n=1 Tax=Demequina aurantiaca TaxID=676200 RepID=UPI003D33230C